MKSIKNWIARLVMVLAAAFVLTGLSGCGSSSVLEAASEIAEHAINEIIQEESTREIAVAEPQSKKKNTSENQTTTDSSDKSKTEIKKDGEYTSKEEVAEYLYIYGELPSNFITKKEAKALGWDSSSNYVGDVAPGKSIGGDKFGNYEGLLPEKEGRQYYECDINYKGKKRGAERIIYSNDGLIYYTEDHYENFELLYGEE